MECGFLCCKRWRIASRKVAFYVEKDLVLHFKWQKNGDFIARNMARDFYFAIFFCHDFSKTGVHVHSLVMHKYSFRRFGHLRQSAA